MAQTDRVSQATLKRELDSLSQEQFQIDLRIQQFKKSGNMANVQNLEVVKISYSKVNSRQANPAGTKESTREKGVLGWYGSIAILGFCIGKTVQ